MAAIEYLTVEHLSTKDLTRIFSKICIHPDLWYDGTPCWIWTGNRQTYGHGRARWKGICEQSYRLVFAWLIHPLPRGAKFGELDHLCCRPSCCNSLHLEFTDHRTNVLRGRSLQAINAAKTHCSQGHSFSGANLHVSAKRARTCRTCRNARVKKHDQAHPGIYAAKRALRMRLYVAKNRDKVNSQQRINYAKRKLKRLTPNPLNSPFQ